MLPVMIMIGTSIVSPLQWSLHLGTGQLPVTPHQSGTLIVFGSTHVTEGECNAWECVTSGSNFSSMLASFCPDVAGINCATRMAKSCELCTITSLFLLINFRQIIYFVHPPIPSTTHFSWDEAKYFHEIMPLTFWVILSLWYTNYDCMMVPSCEILVTK